MNNIINAFLTPCELIQQSNGFFIISIYGERKLTNFCDQSKAVQYYESKGYTITAIY